MKMTSSGPAKVAGANVIGFQSDGRDVMIVHLARIKKQIHIISLQRLTLTVPLDSPIGAGGAAAPMPAADLSPFGSDLESTVAGIVASGEAPESDEQLFHSALARMPLSHCKLAFAVSPSNVRFFNAGEPLTGEKPDNMRERIRLEAAAKIGEQVTTLNSYVEIQKNGPSWCLIHRDEMMFVNRLEIAKKHIGNPRLRYGVVDAVEVALAGLLNHEWPAESHEITALIHIGHEFTHLILVRGSDILTVAPLIQTGVASPALLQTLASKILLEQDEVGVSEIHRIALSGTLLGLEAPDFFARRYPNVKVHTLGTGGCEIDYLTDEERVILPEFTVATGLALKLLSPKGFWKSNLLPDVVKRSQRVLSMSWHGYLLILLLFASTVFLTFTTAGVKRDVAKHNTMLIQRKKQDAENQQLRMRYDSLVVKLAEMQRLLKVSDSLSAGSQRWAKLLRTFELKGRKIGNIWIESIQSTKTGFTLQGKSLYRARIDAISSIYENTVIQSVTRVEIQNKTIYQFEMRVPFPPEDIPAAPTSGTPLTPAAPAGGTAPKTNANSEPVIG